MMEPTHSNMHQEFNTVKKEVALVAITHHRVSYSGSNGAAIPGVICKVYVNSECCDSIAVQVGECTGLIFCYPSHWNTWSLDDTAVFIRKWEQ